MQRLTRYQLIATAVVALASAVFLADPALATAEPMSIDAVVAALGRA